VLSNKPQMLPHLLVTDSYGLVFNYNCQKQNKNKQTHSIMKKPKHFYCFAWFPRWRYILYTSLYYERTGGS